MEHSRKFNFRKIKTRQKKAKSVGTEAFITDSNAYKYFNRNVKRLKRKGISNSLEFSTIINAFFDEIVEEMANNPDGVFIEGLGYFGVMAINYNSGLKSFFYDEETDSVYKDYDLRAHSDGISFAPHFVPIERTQALRTWNMDGCFFSGVKKKMIKKLEEGMKYNFQAPLFYQYSGQRKSKKDEI